jgi:hypothetical protein
MKLSMQSPVLITPRYAAMPGLRLAGDCCDQPSASKGLTLFQPDTHQDTARLAEARTENPRAKHRINELMRHPGTPTSGLWVLTHPEDKTPSLLAVVSDHHTNSKGKPVVAIEHLVSLGHAKDSQHPQQSLARDVKALYQHLKEAIPQHKPEVADVLLMSDPNQRSAMTHLMSGLHHHEYVHTPDGLGGEATHVPEARMALYKELGGGRQSNRSLWVMHTPQLLRGDVDKMKTD